MWSFLLEEYKEIVSLSIFQRKTSNWEADVCPCRLCKTIYTANAFYVNFHLFSHNSMHARDS